MNALAHLKGSIGYDVAGLLLTGKENKVYMVGGHLLSECARVQFRDMLLKGYNSLVDRPIRQEQTMLVSREAAPCCHGMIPQLASYLSTPLVAFDEVLGIIAIGSGLESADRDGDLFALSLAASQLSAYVSNIRFYQAAKHYAEVAKSLKKQAEAERQWLQVVIDNLPEGVIIVSAPRGEVVVNNKKAQEIVGLLPTPGATIEDYLKHIRLFRPDGDRYSAKELPMSRSFSFGETHIGVQVEVERPDGTRVITLGNSTPILDSEGNITGAVAVFQDISALKRLERLKDEFIGTVSHELKSPLTTVMGAATALHRHGSRLAEEHRKLLVDDIVQEAQRMRLLIDNLLDLARADAGRLVLNSRRFQVADLACRLIEDFAKRFKDFHFSCQLSEGLPPVFADPVRVEQVLRNLLSNAVKYSAKGGHIRITGEPMDGRVAIRVSDEGVGIPKEQLDKIFEQFYRAPSASRTAGGTGMGLVVCRRLVEAHGGCIWAESEPGRGATFTFTLPRAGE